MNLNNQGGEPKNLQEEYTPEKEEVTPEITTPENKNTAIVDGAKKPTIEEKNPVWVQARKTADNQLLKSIRQQYGLSFGTVDEFKSYLGEMLDQIKVLNDGKEIRKEKDQPPTLDNQLKEEISRLKKTAEQFQTVQQEKEELEKRYREEKLETVFRNALMKANCNDLDLIVQNRGIFSKLMLDPDMRGVSVLDEKGDISMETLDDYVESIRKKHPKLFTVIKNQSKSDIPSVWNTQVNTIAELQQKNKAGLQYILSQRKG